MSFGNTIARMIEEALANLRVRPDQLAGQLPAATLPPTGNTGSGYTPASHTHSPDEIEQGGASTNDVLTWDGSEWAPAAPSSSGVSDGDKGDIVVSSGGTVWTLDTSGVSAATYGSATQAPQIAVDAKGRITSASNVAITGVTPAAHATSHQSGGGDAIKLDDLATPDDTTDLDATTGHHGLLPKLGGGTTNFLRADGTWAAPSGSGGTWTQLASGQLGADGSISLTSISGSYKHLKLILTLRTTQSAAQSSFLVRVNNDTTAGNYHGQRFAVQNGTFQVVNNGATATLVQGIAPGDTALASSFGGYELTFHDYADTDKIKTCFATGGFWQLASSGSGSVLQIDTGGWNSTSAITRIDVVAGSGSLKTGCSYELYGIT